MIPIRLPLEPTHLALLKKLCRRCTTSPAKTEEPGLPDDEFHLWQAELLSQTFRPPQYAAEQIFVARFESLL